jgi:hypothetical protein
MPVSQVAERLTQWENYRTVEDFEVCSKRLLLAGVICFGNIISQSALTR